ATDKQPTPLPEILESIPVPSSAEDTTLSNRPQWGQKLVQSVKEIDLSGITTFFDRIKAKLAQ
ncbi:MAG: hypothetical protein WBM62_06610, partial [Crocosphaera sp.]